jgi:hypothetical protein
MEDGEWRIEDGGSLSRWHGLMAEDRRSRIEPKKSRIELKQPRIEDSAILHPPLSIFLCPLYVLGVLRQAQDRFPAVMASILLAFCLYNFGL